MASDPPGSSLSMFQQWSWSCQSYTSQKFSVAQSTHTSWSSRCMMKELKTKCVCTCFTMQALPESASQSWCETWAQQAWSCDMREKYRGIKGRFLARLGHGPWAMGNGKWQTARGPVGTKVQSINAHPWQHPLVDHKNRKAFLDLVILDALSALLLFPVPCSVTRLVWGARNGQKRPLAASWSTGMTGADAQVPANNVQSRHAIAARAVRRGMLQLQNLCYLLWHAQCIMCCTKLQQQMQPILQLLAWMQDQLRCSRKRE